MDYHSNHPYHITRDNPIRLAFIGSGREYFRIWFVNLCLTIITLGIYSPWAKVRRERYFANHTLLKDSPFEYHARPLSILKGRLLALGILVAINLAGLIDPLLSLITIPLIFVALPWIFRASIRFRAANTSWRGIRFSFRGTTWGACKVIYGWGILIVLTLGLAMPAFIRAWHRYIFNNLYFGSSQFDVETRIGAYYRPYATLTIIVTLIGAGGFYAFMELQPHIERLIALIQVDNLDPILIAVISAVPFLALFFFQLVSYLYIQVSIRNHLFNHLLISRHGLGSDLRLSSMLALTLWHGFLVVVTLGLYLPAFIIALRGYRTTHTLIYQFGSLEDFMASNTEKATAFGEEVGEFMDLDIGL